LRVHGQQRVFVERSSVGTPGVYELALEGMRVSFEDLELGLLNQIGVLFAVVAPSAPALRSTVDSSGEAFAVKLEALGFGAGALGTRTIDHGHSHLLDHLDELMLHIGERRGLTKLLRSVAEERLSMLESLMLRRLAFWEGVWKL
jgi:hypothetical protein